MSRKISSLTDTHIGTIVSPELARKVRTLAVESNTPIRQIIEQALTMYFRDLT